MAAAPTVADLASDDGTESFSMERTMDHVITTYCYPAIRLAIALGVVWMTSKVSK
jgi:hypothetical protein